MPQGKQLLVGGDEGGAEWRTPTFLPWGSFSSRCVICPLTLLGTVFECGFEDIHHLSLYYVSLQTRLKDELTLNFLQAVSTLKKNSTPTLIHPTACSFCYWCKCANFCPIYFAREKFWSTSYLPALLITSFAVLHQRSWIQVRCSVVFKRGIGPVLTELIPSIPENQHRLFQKQALYSCWQVHLKLSLLCHRTGKTSYLLLSLCVLHIMHEFACIILQPAICSSKKQGRSASHFFGGRQDHGESC